MNLLFDSRNRESNFGHLCEHFYGMRIICVNTFFNHRDTMATATATSQLEQQIQGTRLTSRYGDLDSVSRLTQIRLNAATLTLIILDQKWSERIIDAIVRAWVRAKVSIPIGLILRGIEMGHGHRRSPFNHPEATLFMACVYNTCGILYFALVSRGQRFPTDGTFFDELF
jgi:hypothetical protein